MEPTYQLSPESARALAVRLYSKEQFTADPRGCILKALDWLDQAAGEPSLAAAVNLVRDSRIERLDRIAQEQGLEVVSEKVGVSQNSVRAWLRGAPPNAASFAKIERFLEMPSPAAAEKPAESAELFVAEPPATPEPTTQS